MVWLNKAHDSVPKMKSTALQYASHSYYFKIGEN